MSVWPCNWPLTYPGRTPPFPNSSQIGSIPYCLHLDPALKTTGPVSLLRTKVSVWSILNCFCKMIQTVLLAWKTETLTCHCISFDQATNRRRCVLRLACFVWLKQELHSLRQKQTTLLWWVYKKKANYWCKMKNIHIRRS